MLQAPPPPTKVIPGKFKGLAPLKDLAIPFLGIYPEKTTSKRYMHPLFIAAVFTITTMWKQPKYPLTDEWIKMSYVYIQWNTVQP